MSSKIKTSGGIVIKNDKILLAIEKIPPHFYYNLFYPSKDVKKIDINEVL